MLKNINKRIFFIVICLFCNIATINPQDSYTFTSKSTHSNKNQTNEDDFDNIDIPKLVDMSNDMYSLDLSAAIDMGIKNNLDLQNNKLDLNSKTLDIASSWNNLLSSSISVNYRNGIVSQNTPTPNAGNVSVSMENGININAANIYRIISSITSYREGKLSYENAKQTLKTEIKKQYFNLSIQKQRIWLKQIEVQNAMVAYNKAKMKFRDGMTSEVDFMSTQYDFYKLLPDLDSYYNTYINTEATFKQLLGMEIDKQFYYVTKIPEDISHIEVDDNLRKNLDNNFTITNYIFRLKEAVNSRNQAILSATTPTFSLTHSLSLLDNNTFAPSNDVGLSLSFRINTPLPFSTEQVNIAKNVYNVKKAANNLNDIKQKQLISLNNLINDITLNEKNIKSYNMSIKIAEKKFDMVSKQYDFGIVDYLQYQEAQEAVSNAKLQLIEAKIRYLSNIFDLEYMLQTEIIDFK